MDLSIHKMKIIGCHKNNWAPISVIYLGIFIFIMLFFIYISSEFKQYQRYTQNGTKFKVDRLKILRYIVQSFSIKGVNFEKICKRKNIVV